jgi:hypothetical protein
MKIYEFLANNPWGIKATEIGIPTSTATVDKGLANVVKLMITAIGLLSIVVLIVGGIFYAISHGDPKLIQRGKDTVLYAVIGLLVAIGAYAVVTFIGSI